MNANGDGYRLFTLVATLFETLGFGLMSDGRVLFFAFCLVFLGFV